LDHASSAARDSFLLDHRAASTAARGAVTSQRASSAERFWDYHWLPYTRSLGLTPYLMEVRDKIPILCVLAHRIRDGRASRSGRPVRADRVCDELCAVGQGFTRMGLPDPRYTSLGVMDPRLARLYRAYANLDPPPNRVKPIPIQVLHRATALLANTPNQALIAAVDLAWLAFFFLLRPGEYCHGSGTTPLCLKHVTFFREEQRLHTLQSPLLLLHQATHVSLTFDTQKNRNRGEIVGHGRSGHPIACPTATLLRRVTYLRSHPAALNTPLCTIFSPQPVAVPTALITNILQEATTLCPGLGFLPADVNARSLRAGGAMALLCGRVDAPTIRLVGRWQSDAMFRYLHSQTVPVLQNLAHTMVQHGNYRLLPGVGVPQAALDLQAEAEAEAALLR
jgi:hypothetical protein